MAVSPSALSLGRRAAASASTAGGAGGRRRQREHPWYGQFDRKHRQRAPRGADRAQSNAYGILAQSIGGGGGNGGFSGCLALGGLAALEVSVGGSGGGGGNAGACSVTERRQSLHRVRQFQTAFWPSRSAAAAATAASASRSPARAPTKTSAPRARSRSAGMAASPGNGSDVIVDEHGNRIDARRQFERRSRRSRSAAAAATAASRSPAPFTSGAVGVGVSVGGFGGGGGTAGSSTVDSYGAAAAAPVPIPAGRRGDARDRRRSMSNGILAQSHWRGRRQRRFLGRRSAWRCRGAGARRVGWRFWRGRRLRRRGRPSRATTIF